MPLKRIEVGPFSSAAPCPEAVSEELTTAALLAAMLATVEFSAVAVDFTSAEVVTASTALVFASDARALAEAAASRASSNQKD